MPVQARQTCNLVLALSLTWLRCPWPDCNVLDLVAMSLTWLQCPLPDCTVLDPIAMYLTWLHSLCYCRSSCGIDGPFSDTYWDGYPDPEIRKVRTSIQTVSSEWSLPISGISWKYNYLRIFVQMFFSKQFLLYLVCIYPGNEVELVWECDEKRGALHRKECESAGEKEERKT